MQFTTAAEAAKLIRSHSSVYIQGSTSIPEVLVQAMTDRADELTDVKIYSGFAVGRADAPYCRPEYKDTFLVNSLFVANNIRRWLAAGADGWRLDVADELPDDFVRGIHEAARAEKPDAVIIGEVWEDGSTKVAYGVRRRHIMGRHCDGLMNYPFRNAVLSYLKGGDAADFVNAMETLRENYPRFAYYSAMNSLGTHDTARILTLLGAEEGCEHQSKEWRSNYRLGPDQRRRAKELLKLGAALMFAFPGSPTVYYGDEVGMEGFEDPFNRRTYPGAEAESSLLAYLRQLSALRNQRLSLQCGDIGYLYAVGGGLVLRRQSEDEVTVAAMNAGMQPLELSIPWAGALAKDALTGQQFFARNGMLRLTLPPVGGVLLV